MKKADIALAVIPWGRADIARVNEIIEKAELDEGALAEFMQEQWIETESDLAELDPVALAYQFILNHAAGLERRLGSKHSSLEGRLRVAANFVATSFDFKGEDRYWINNSLEVIVERTGDPALRWMMGEIG